MPNCTAPQIARLAGPPTVKVVGVLSVEVLSKHFTRVYKYLSMMKVVMMMMMVMIGKMKSVRVQ